MIPKILHTCWFGPAKKSSVLERCEASWQKLKNWDIRCYSEKDLPDHVYIYDSLDKGEYSNVSNFFRLYILYIHGGVYLDTDMEVLKPFDPLLDSQMFFGWESPTYANSAVLGSEPGNDLLALMLSRVKRLPGVLSDISGPKMLTAFFLGRGMEYTGSIQKLDGTAIYPEEYFYPIWEHRPKGRITENSYTNHHWTHLW